MKAHNPQIPYSREELFRPGAPIVYSGRQLDKIAFPLGGIGTGSISLRGDGSLDDFEIFNRPDKGLLFAYTLLALHARRGDDEPVTKVLQGPTTRDLTGNGAGPARESGAGFPHFRSLTFEGAFPFARLSFRDGLMPLDVSLEAWNPLIPLNPDDSGLPAALFYVTLRNPGDAAVSATLFASLENRAGHPDVGDGRIEHFDSGNVRGLHMSTRRHEPDSPRYGTLALATPHKNVSVQTCAFHDAWFDMPTRFWEELSAGRLTENRETVDQGGPYTNTGVIGLNVNVPPGGSVRLPVWITWHTPNFEKYWGNHDPRPVWKNYYATQHADARAVAEYVAGNETRLESETRAFADALYGSTLPAAVLDAVGSQIAVLKTTTCLRLEDGTFYGWEGCHPGAGCCEGTCTHVWNYAQAMPYLFPSLERSIRDADYEHNAEEDGRMRFRMPLPLGAHPDWGWYAATDGQLGGILKVYRDWRICGDDRWLKRIWPHVKAGLEYAWTEWDKNRDGVMEGVQHNTYDVEFHGPNTMLGSFYLAALRAGEEMARRLGDEEAADAYRAVFESGSRKTDRALFNGEFYVQDVRPGGKRVKGLDPRAEDFPKYQYGAGCLSDQLIGQWYARMLELGDLYRPKNVRSALAAVFRHNWISDVTDHVNPERIYALEDEAALVCATWPDGGRPAFPFPYADEVFCGIEYQVASHLIYEGMVEEGLAVTKGVRDRHDGARRNPWNEFECGNHYARSMASYSLLTALSGFQYSAPESRMALAPCVYEDDFRCFFAVDSGWGVLHQSRAAGRGRTLVELKAGSLRLREVTVGFEAQRVRVSAGGKAVRATTAIGQGRTVVRLGSAVVLRPDRPLVIEGL